VTHEVPPGPSPGGRRGPRPLTALIVLGIGIVAVVALSAFLPRWWAHRVGDQVDGSFASGIGLGLFYGFAFTVLPLAIAWFAFRRLDSWKARLLILGVAVLIAAPNLLTLSIVVGIGSAAHAGERTFDVEAPGFRASSLFGAIAAVLALTMVGLLLRSRRRSRAEAAALRAELANRQQDG
jgi:hypothetical protein